MKTIIICLFSLFFFVSCNSKNSVSKNVVSDTGVVNVPYGKDLIDTVEYTCTGCEENLNPELFNTIITSASKEAKENLNNPLSFIPSSIDIAVMKQDSLMYYDSDKIIDSCLSAYVTYKCIGKNAYGTEGEVENTSKFYIVKNRIVDDLISKVKKNPLSFDNEDKIISRQLYLYDDDETITVIPVKDNSLIIKTSKNCVDKGARLTIHFVNEEKITLTNWNDFNCKGTSYYNLNKEHFNKLKANKVKYISFYDDSSIFCSVRDNDSDYLMQYANLVAL